MKLYSEDHQWIEIIKGVGTIGITAYAVDELGKVTFVDLPAVGATLTQGEPICVVESAKAASDVFAPVSGTVIAVNHNLDEEPELLNAGPETDGWICRINEIDPAEYEVLMNEDEYEQFVSGEGGDE